VTIFIDILFVLHIISQNNKAVTRKSTLVRRFREQVKHGETPARNDKAEWSSEL